MMARLAIIFALAAIFADFVEWAEYYDSAYSEYLCEFDSIFDKVEFKRSKNNRPMIKGAYSNTFKFISTREK